MIKSGNPKTILFIASFLLVYSFCFGFSPIQNANTPLVEISYTDVVSYADGFIAITNNGRIDWISDKGDVTKTKSFNGESFKSILINNQQLILLGLHGQILFFKNDSSFYKMENPSGNSFKCITHFRNEIIAGCENGELCFGYDENSFKSFKLELKGNIVSLSSGIKDCYGVTDHGEIIHSNDGLNWTIFDFNSVYNGYYKTCNFIKVETTPSQIAVVGKNDEGLPVLFFSSKGNVWTKRPLNYTNEEGFHDLLNNIPSDIYYDATNDQFILLCSDGNLMTIPTCSHCQKIYQISKKNLTAIAGNESKILVVGNNMYIKLCNSLLL